MPQDWYCADGLRGNRVNVFYTVACLLSTAMMSWYVPMKMQGVSCLGRSVQSDLLVLLKGRLHFDRLNHVSAVAMARCKCNTMLIGFWFAIPSLAPSDSGVGGIPCYDSGSLCLQRDKYGIETQKKSLSRVTPACEERADDSTAEKQERPSIGIWYKVLPNRSPTNQSISNLENSSIVKRSSKWRDRVALKIINPQDNLSLLITLQRDDQAQPR